MKKKHKAQFCRLSSLCLFFLIYMKSGYAQVSSDTSLLSIVKSNDGRNFEISGGKQVSGNLFHSFRTFSIPISGSVSFKNVQNIENILGRVTGNSISKIDGLIRSSGNANLFLINPNGIIFGKKSVLDIGGSALFGTPDSIQFSEGGKFGIKTSSDSIPLIRGQPNGFIFSNQSNPIVNRSLTLNSFGFPVGIAVKPQKSIILLGGDIDVRGGFLSAPGGRIELGSVDIGSEVKLSRDGEFWKLNYAGVSDFRDINIDDGAFLNTSDVPFLNPSFGRSGEISLRGRNIRIGNNSELASVNFGIIKGGSIFLHASEKVNLSDDSFISTFTLSNGPSGDIHIKAKNLQVFDSIINAATQSTGRGGSLFIDISDTTTIDSNGSVSTLSASTTDKGNAGNIFVKTKFLQITDGALITTTTTSDGDAGDIFLDDIESIVIKGNRISFITPGRIIQSGIFSRSLREQSTGNAGSITIKTSQLFIQDGASISVVAAQGSSGRAGNIEISAAKHLHVDGVDSSILAESDSKQAAGDLTIDTTNFIVSTQARISTRTIAGIGGTVKIGADQFTLRDGASISTATIGSGSAGNILINVKGQISITGETSGLFANTDSDGNSGEINVITDKFFISEGAVIDARTSGLGIGGNIVIRANDFYAHDGGKVLTTTQSNSRAGNISLFVRDNLNLVGQGSGLFSATTPNSKGNGGNIFIDPVQILISNGAGIAVNSLGEGDAGNISLYSGSITLDDRAFISAETDSGDGGIIDLDIANLLLLKNTSSISTTARNSGDGGNISIDSKFIVAFPNDNSDISANAFEGNGGNIRVKALKVFGITPSDRLTPFSDIVASSEFGLSGTVEIDSPETDPTNGIKELPENVVDTSSLATKYCSIKPEKLNSDTSSFVVTGNGGIPVNPDDLVSKSSVLPNWILNSSNTVHESYNDLGSEYLPGKITSHSNISKLSKNISEANGWISLPDGKVLLTNKLNSRVITAHAKVGSPSHVSTLCK